VVAATASEVAQEYHLHHGGTECFPSCTFKQDLANWVGIGAF